MTTPMGDEHDDDDDYDSLEGGISGDMPPGSFVEGGLEYGDDGGDDEDVDVLQEIETAQLMDDEFVVDAELRRVETVGADDDDEDILHGVNTLGADRAGDAV